MATGKIPLPLFRRDKNYSLFKREVEAWQEVTDVKLEKQGIVLALSLPDIEDFNLREKVFENLSVEKLKGDDGVKDLIKFLDEQFGKDELEDSLQKFEDFDDYFRGPSENIAQFITSFDLKYNRIKTDTLKLPSEILAFKLLRRARLSKAEKLLVISGMNYQEKNSLYDQAKRSLKKFIGKEFVGVVELPKILTRLRWSQLILPWSEGVLDHGVVIQGLGEEEPDLGILVLQGVVKSL